MVCTVYNGQIYYNYRAECTCAWVVHLEMFIYLPLGQGAYIAAASCSFPLTTFDFGTVPAQYGYRWIICYECMYVYVCTITHNKMIFKKYFQVSTKALKVRKINVCLPSLLTGSLLYVCMYRAAAVGVECKCCWLRVDKKSETSRSHTFQCARI
jgi:hypothetical protein